MRIHLPLTALVLAAAALAAGCAASPSSSGLTSANPGSYAPPVYGSRSALSDPREQTAAPRAPAGETKSRNSDLSTRTRTDEPRQRIATARGEAERTAAPAPAVPRHEAVDTGRRKALEAAKEAEKPGEKGRGEGKQATQGAKPPAGGNVVEVAPGDSLLKIATRHKVSVSALMSANRLASLTVEPGQRLIIPSR